MRLQLDDAAMQLDEALDQGQAEPGAGLPRLRIAALEFLEDACLVFARRRRLPVSETTSATRSPSRRAASVTVPPAGVNLSAFETRLNIACFRRRSSPESVPISGGQSNSRRRPWACARAHAQRSARPSCRA